VTANDWFPDIFRSNSVFIGDNCRRAVNEGRGDFIPIFLSEVPLLFERGLKKLDVALVTVSPPDSHGFCTLSTNVDTALSAVRTAKHVIGQYIYIYIYTHTHTHTQPFNGLFSRTTWVSRYQKGKASLDLNEARDDGALGCSGISWTICKQSAPRCR